MKRCTNAQKGRWMLLFTIFLTVISVLLGISLGSTRISPADFLQAVFSGSTTDSTYRIVMYSRLPGVLGALLAGSALSVSGAILQSVLQNQIMVISLVIGFNKKKCSTQMIIIQFTQFSMVDMV